ncbi:hypothetical protein [Legionella pneumophila]|uniref:hypothetical protein n=1 Tax=Legionella pneumophila TaxID=446 RepID=UPI00077083BF|nr:hypothetical protein [Legionella pneumophila]CZH64285.1 Uncharacterised protein [Legionella pneumophila]CZM87939.1 Uncharacterised protein [Legionella pneumophila]CZM93928.1 Uncharacterised protein [Legionella pneumophila]CZN47343.1 Uncharacterised protein [Legionella pneumophila]CZN49422.1 Uncharacterised protein [Legionella pneumophila]
MKYIFLFIGLIVAGINPVFASVLPSSKDAQLCTNAYNKLWHIFDSVKADHRGDPAAQSAIFNVEFPKVLAEDFSLTINNLLLSPIVLKQLL